MLLTSWLRSLQSTALFSPRLFGRRRNLQHHRQWQKRRHTRGPALAAAGLEKLEDRILLAAPVFNQGSYTFSVSENTPPPYSVGQVSVGDSDFMDTHTFSILAGNEHDRFAMSTAQYPGGAMGYVRLVNPLDYERQAQYQLTVEVRDSTGLTDTATVFVNIGDVAEEGDGDPNFHANADADATGEAPAAVSDGALSVNQLTGDATVSPAAAFGIGGDELPVYQSGTLARPIVNVDAQLTAGNLPTRIDATLTFGGLQQQTVSFNVDSSLDGQKVRLALPADATTLATGHYNWSAAVTLVYSGSSSTQNFSGKREIINETNSPVGAGWRISAVDRLHFDGTGGATLARGDGTAAYFAYSNGTLQSPAGSLARLVNNGDGTHSIIHNQGGQDVFNSTSGLQIKRIARNGQETAYSYVDGNGDGQARELSQISYPNGKQAVYTWSSNKLQAVTDSKGRTFSIARDGNGQIESFTGPDPDGAGGSQTSPVARFAYHATTGLLDTITDPANETSTIGWSAARRVAQYTRADTTSWSVQPAQTRGHSAPVKTADVSAVHTDAAGKVWSRKTDRYGYVTQETTPLSHTRSISRDGFGLRTGESNGARFGFKNPDWKGRVVSQTNPDGTVETWTFGSDSFPDNPTSYKDAKGRTWNFDYDMFGNLTDVQSPDGGLTEYGWNSAGLLASITLPDPDGAGPRVRPLTTVQYDTSHRPVTITNPDNTTRTFTWDTSDNLTSETDELGRTTTYTHDAWGRVLTQTLPDPDSTGPSAAPTWQWVYSSRGEVVQEIDPAGNVTDFTYDDLGRLIKLQQPPATTGGARPTWQWTYDANSNVLTEQDPNGNVTSHAYDDANRRISTTLPDPDGATGPLTAPVWQTAFDQWDRVIQTTDPLGRVTDLAWYAWTTAPSGDQANAGKLHTITLADPDGAGPAARPVITHTWDKTGNLLSQSDPLNRVTSWVRDSLDRVIETRLPDPDGAGIGQPAPVYTTVWDGLSNVLVQRDALGNEVAFTYDLMSRVLTQTGEDPDDTGPLTGPVTTLAWTNAGELQSLTDPAGRTTSFVRDGLGRVVTTVLPDTDGTGGNPAPELHTTYDILSRVISTTDALGNQTLFAYDKLSRLTERRDSDPDGAGPLGNPITTFAWDLVGNMTSLTDSVGNSTSWVRDNLYRVTSETNELNKTRTWQYDAVNNVVSQTDRNGRTIERDFDGLNRLIEERWLDGQTIVNTLEFGWDIASQLGTASDDFSGYAWTYDGMGRTTQTDNSPRPDMPNVVLTHGWDANRQRTSLAATINGTADFSNTYVFDPLGQMTRIQQTDGAPSSGYTVSDKRVDLTYTQAGEFATISRYEDLTATDLVATSTYGRDDAGRLTSLVHAKGSTTLASYGWQFDAQGRITQATSNDGTTTFTYDTNHQLTAADHSYQTDESYSFDENGNRTSAGSATYTVGTNNRITSDGTYTYTYDDEGNRTRKTNIATGEYVDFTWDHRNRLTAVTFKTSADVTIKKIVYAYDMFNVLISRRVDSNGDGTFDSGQRFVYDTAPGKGGLSDIVLVLDDTGSLTNRYLHGPAVDQVFADENALGEILWGLTDHQGTVRDVADYDAATDTTSVVNHLKYDSFGTITSQTNSALQPLLAWTGRYRDAETGLQWNLNRWYDPVIGRWLSEDPIGFAGGDENLSRYVGNSPVLFVDPTGLTGYGPWGSPAEYARWYGNLMQGMRAMAPPAPPTRGWLASAGDTVSGIWNDYWLMTLHAGETVPAFVQAVPETFASGEAWDSYQCAVNQMGDTMTADLFDFSSAPPAFGNQEAHDNAQPIGTAWGGANWAAIGAAVASYSYNAYVTWLASPAGTVTISGITYQATSIGSYPGQVLIPNGWTQNHLGNFLWGHGPQQAAQAVASFQAQPWSQVQPWMSSQWAQSWVRYYHWVVQNFPGNASAPSRLELMQAYLNHLTSIGW